MRSKGDEKKKYGECIYMPITSLCDNQCGSNIRIHARKRNKMMKKKKKR